MKTRALTLSFLSAAAALGALVALHPIYAQESSQLRRSGKIELSVDPTQDGFGWTNGVALAFSAQRARRPPARVPIPASGRVGLPRHTQLRR